jgi:ankyrin repeat protein
MVVPKSDQVEPLWSMKVACTNGLRLDGQKVLLFPRNGSNVEQWTLDVVSGDILEFSDGPTKGEGAPQDSHSALSSGKPRTLNRPEVAPITPSGFEPLVLTDRFLFARRSRLRFSYPRFFHDGETIVIDRGTGKIIWTQIGINTAIIASSAHVFICDQQNTAAFGLSSGRPKEVTDFYSAVRAGDLVKAQELYPFRRRTQLFDLGGYGPLTVAAKEKCPKMVELLLSLGESPNSTDADGFVPLLMALHWNNPDIARILLNAGADPNYKSHLWALPLNEAVAEGRRPIIEDLLQKGARVNSKGGWTGGTALHEAVMYRNYEAIETLLAAGADVHAPDGRGLTPAQKAPGDECVIYLFSGGKIADKPGTCQPPKRESTPHSL